MSSPAVFLTRRLPESVAAELRRHFELTIFDSDDPPGRRELLAGVAGMDGVCTMVTDIVDDEFLEAAGSQLQIVANYGVGYNNIDLEACSNRGVLVTNTPDVLTETSAEFTVALMLALVRRLSEGDRMLHRGDDWQWSPSFMLGAGLKGKLLGIVGLGRIGSEVARLATAFGMRVSYTNRTGPLPDVDYSFSPFDELIRTVDLLSLHCPLTAETHHLIGAAELGSMRQEAFLINTSRGPVVDEVALVEALRAGEIAGAALDVYEHEPELAPGLSSLENVVLAPHLASATTETREAMGMLCVSALRDLLIEGRIPDNELNAEAVGSQLAD